MLKIKLKTAVLCVICCCMMREAGAQSFLHAEGEYMVNEEGQQVLLQGVGLGNWMLPEGYMWKFGEHGDRPRKIEKLVEDYLGAEKSAAFWKTYRKNYVKEADIKRIADLGFNSVRPALNARLFLTEGENPVFVEEGFQLLDSLIDWCKKYHLYVIIDMHGAPGGQTGQNIDDSPNNEPELFMHSKNEDLLVKLWVKLADKYKNEPIVAAYDLLNEPLPERTGAADKYKAQLVPLYNKLIKAIRSVDKKHMFTIEGFNWANNWSLFTKPLDDNMFFQFHYYCWDKPDNLNDISYFLKKREELHTPVWVGETGEKNNTIYFATAQYFEANHIGWSFWPWKKMDTQNTPYSIKQPEGWRAVSKYSRDGKNLDKQGAEEVFKELLENIKLENCIYFPDVVNAMLRRAPLKLEAENYGHEGYGKSYLVKDTSLRSANYRKMEPVQIQVDENGSGQYLILKEGEWTAYQVKSTEQREYQFVLRAKADQASARLFLNVNGKREPVTLTKTGWQELDLKPQQLKTGENSIKIEVEKGEIAVDWINVY